MQWSNQKDDEWNSGDYQIRRGEILQPGSVTAKQEIFHCYAKGLYIAQAQQLTDAQTKCEEHLQSTQ